MQTLPEILSKVTGWRSGRGGGEGRRQEGRGGREEPYLASVLFSFPPELILLDEGKSQLSRKLGNTADQGNQEKQI